jgi:hypothetical protein
MVPGIENAFIRIRTIDRSGCLNMLYAFVGDIQNSRWRDWGCTGRNELKDFFDTFN